MCIVSSLDIYTAGQNIWIQCQDGYVCRINILDKILATGDISTGFTAGHSAVDLLVFEFSLRLGVMAQQKKEEKSYVENHHQKVDQGAVAQD